MKHLSSVAIGAMIFLLPAAGMAESIFDTFYNEAAQTIDGTPVSDAIVQFTIDQMRLWGPRGIVLTAEDIRLAQLGDTKVCLGKKDRNGDTIPPMSSGLGAYTCDGLKQAIKALIESERQAQLLGDTLITIANGNEMAIADEAHRGSNVGQLTATFGRLWSGTGSQAEAWPTDAGDAVTQLESALSDEQKDLDAIMLRFHHGYFRDARENDPRFRDIGPKTRDALEAIASRLNIAGDTRKTGDIATPVLKTKNVTLWARKDDIGLQWTYPTHLERMNIQAAWDYPQRAEGGQSLAYPYAYRGEPRAGQAYNIASPLCSRSQGRFGFLCRPLPAASGCNSTTGSGALSSITLTRCSHTITETPPGTMQLCSGALLLYKDTGKAVGDLQPGDKADPKDICSPESNILYQDDTTQHACYISSCLRQSMSGHTIIPLRNTTLSTEVAAPFHAFERNDPQLGLYAEMSSSNTPVILPPYLGLDLVALFERDYCAQNGLPPGPLAGYCSYQNNRRDASPLAQLSAMFGSYTQEAADLASDLDQTAALGAATGYRLSLDQSLPIYRTTAASLAQTVRTIANLFNELKSAPLTRQLCPWIGAPQDTTLTPVEP